MKLLTLWKAYLGAEAKLDNWDGIAIMDGPLTDKEWKIRNRKFRQSNKLEKAIAKRIAQLEGQQ